MFNYKERNIKIMNRSKTHKITVSAVLSAIAVIFMYFEIPLWFAPSFYEIDLSELPVLIGAFAFGPAWGVLIEAVKILIALLVKGTTTGGVGEFGNFLIGISFVLPASLIYKAHKTKKGAVLGMGLGIVCLATVGALINGFVLIPMYTKFIPLENIIAMSREVNGFVKDIKTLVLFAVVPFNVLKGIIVSVITAIIYKKLRVII